MWSTKTHKAGPSWTLGGHLRVSHPQQRALDTARCDGQRQQYLSDPPEGETGGEQETLLSRQPGSFLFCISAC